jgi:GNAT superfamily N-acetyltransferase
LALQVVAADNKQAFHDFVEFPYTLYRGDPYFVPQLRIAVKDLLNREKHPFYKNADAEYFLAKRDGRVLGRIAAIFDRNHNKFHEESAGFFGFYESVDDPEVARALLARAREWVFAKGATFLRGPVNPSTNYECGMLIDGFDSTPRVMMTYNPRYYPKLMEASGLKKIKDLNAYVGTVDGADSERIARVADRKLAQKGITVRPINMKDFDNEVERVWEVYNSAWEKNWGFVPMTKEEFFLMGKDMKMILKPEMVLIGEAGNKMIGFALCLPDVNEALIHTGGKLFPTGLLKILYYQRLIKNYRVLALGVIPDYRASGIAAALYATLVRTARRIGMTGDCEMSWILEDNVLMIRSLEAMKAKHYKTYRIYEWHPTAA